MWLVSKFKEAFSSRKHDVLDEAGALESRQEVVKTLPGLVPGERRSPDAMKELGVLHFLNQHRSNEPDHPSQILLQLLSTNAPLPPSTGRIPSTIGRSRGCIAMTVREQLVTSLDSFLYALWRRRTYYGSFWRPRSPESRQ